MNINTEPDATIILGNKIQLKLIGSDLPIQLPQNLAQVVVTIVAILPYIIFIVSIVMIMIGALKWVKSNGNEKELEKAQKTIKNAIFGFISMFLFFFISNFLSYILIGFSVINGFYALAPCGSRGFVSDVLNQQSTNPAVKMLPDYNAYSDENILATYELCKTGGIN